MRLNCKWHKCKREFERAHSQQVFCSASCQRKRRVWKKMRGCPMVDLLLEGRADELIAMRQKILTEIEGKPE